MSCHIILNQPLPLPPPSSHGLPRDHEEKASGRQFYLCCGTPQEPHPAERSSGHAVLLVVGQGCRSWPATPRKRSSCQPASFFTSVF